jgi:spermidine synthase
VVCSECALNMSVLILFFCSGAAALIYEIVWSKYLSLLLGSTVQAQTVVLAAFMGGLALGNRIFGNRADRCQQPLVLYGYLEIAIGIYAFAFDGLYRGADWIFVWSASGLLGQSGVLLAIKAVLGAALLLVPTVLMGGTLPLIAAWLQQRYDNPGRRSARFYSINSLGAVSGAALAGFVLIQQLGLVASLQWSRHCRLPVY